MIEQLLQKLASDVNLSYEEYQKIIEYRELVSKEYGSMGFNKPYSQGSLRLGTIIKAYSKTDNSFFDVDLVAEKNTVDSAQEFKKEAFTTINGVTPENKKPCWAFNLDSKFHIDVVPANPHPSDNNLSWSELAIDITKHDGKEQNYHWESSNPKGYYYWFKDINRRVFGTLYDEKLPQRIDGYTFTDRQLKRMVRTNLQKAIQVTKWLNGKYFSDLSNEKHKPISIILTTLITGIFDHYDYNNTSNLSIEDILKDFLAIMKDMEYKKSEVLLEESFFTKRKVVRPIKAMYRNDNKWYIPNPTNSEENFADKWNDPVDGSKKVNAFFEFINYLDRLLNNPSDLMRATQKPNKQDVPIGNKPYYNGDLCL